MSFLDPVVNYLKAARRVAQAQVNDRLPGRSVRARVHVDRRAEDQRAQRIAEIDATPINFGPVNTQDIDLYEIYLARMRDVLPWGTPLHMFREANRYYADVRFEGIKPVWFEINLMMNPELERPIFACLLSILLGCDKAHDFTRARFRDKLPYSGTVLDDNLDSLMGHFREATIEQVLTFCQNVVNAVPGLTVERLLGNCVCMINLELNRFGCSAYNSIGTTQLQIDIYIGSVLAGIYLTDDAAKDAAFAISRLLGISTVRYGEFVSRASSYNIVTELTPQSVAFPEWEQVQVKIDATSSALNHTDDFGALQDILTREQQVLVLDSASANDPATSGTLDRIFRIFRRTYYTYINQDINAYILIGTTQVNILTAKLKPAHQLVGQGVPPAQADIPKIKLSVTRFLGMSMSGHAIAPKNNSLNTVVERLAAKWAAIPTTSPILSDAQTISFRQIVKRYSMEKTLGDFLQIITYAGTPRPKVFITVDKISGIIAGIFGSTSILDAGSTDDDFFRKLFVTTRYADAKRIRLWDLCQAGGGNVFGKINNISKRLKLMSHSELKNKLKLVGLKITKNVKGKRKYLSRKELETKARLFNKLQNTAKRMKIKIMYKSRNGMYKYKTYKRLQKEINSKYKVSRKYQKPFVRNFNFG
jgi:hypothetical protein